MNISEQQLSNMMVAVTIALQPLVRVLPVTAVEWADQNYYLPKESSYGEGEWKTLPFQVAIMNCMGNDEIRTVNLIKSARVGYTKMVLGVIGYFIEHKSRNTLLFQPTDSAAEDFMKSHVEATIRDVPCPHCGEEQYLKFGDDATPFGLKWEKGKPETVYYLCEHNGCVIRQSELDQTGGRWICDNTGMWTRDGLTFYSVGDEEIPPPRSVTFHIWTAYSPFTTWAQIVYDWLDALKDPNGVKTFVNTTLGETWEEAVGEKLDHQVLMDKVVHYPAAVPVRVVYLTAGIDSQRNRFEMYVWGWAPGEEAFLVDKIIIMGRPDEEETLLRVDAAINKKYRHADGTEMTISRICWDIGGIDGEIVYQRSKKHGVFRVLPVKGASVYGKPVITMPKTRNQRGVYLCEVGTDTAKEILYARMKADPTPVNEATSYAIRFPDNPEIFSQTEAQQLVAEELVEKWEKGKMRLLWDNKKRRNEALDCLVYAYAALRVSVQRWQLDLAVLAASRKDATAQPTLEELAAKLSGGVNGYSR
ncbi:phage terminase large subunit family protein [Shigella boydii]|uniref:Phage terminase large subunit family protein n=1 Tax=Shigella boydii TaxID=621 RepID=A0A8H9E3M9_SHIBO|nr:phage terminase large subunit family protein [Escherichia coli]EGE3747495.1 phage terminase large subunit family protein [Shigella boydii]